jgi:hypothetical protein
MDKNKSISKSLSASVRKLLIIYCWDTWDNFLSIKSLDIHFQSLYGSNHVTSLWYEPYTSEVMVGYTKGEVIITKATCPLQKLHPDVVEVIYNGIHEAIWLYGSSNGGIYKTKISLPS